MRWFVVDLFDEKREGPSKTRLVWTVEMHGNSSAPKGDRATQVEQVPGDPPILVVIA